MSFLNKSLRRTHPRFGGIRSWALVASGTAIDTEFPLLLPSGPGAPIQDSFRAFLVHCGPQLASPAPNPPAEPRLGHGVTKSVRCWTVGRHGNGFLRSRTVGRHGHGSLRSRRACRHGHGFLQSRTACRKGHESLPGQVTPGLRHDSERCRVLARQRQDPGHEDTATSPEQARSRVE